MNFIDRYTKLFHVLLPSPFTIAVLLSFIAFAAALVFTLPADKNIADYSLQLLSFWEAGLWDNALLVFAIQMMLMLVLGHVLAISPPIERLMDRISPFANSSSKAAALVGFSTMVVAFFNWGLGLIFGAILARKVAEFAIKQNQKLNYPLVGAAGYVGLMVWHGGISGSALIKASEPSHLRQLMEGISNSKFIANLPLQITFSETGFSPMNILAGVLLLTFVPLVLFLLGRYSPGKSIPELKPKEVHIKLNSNQLMGAEKLDHSRIFSWLFGGVILFFTIYTTFHSKQLTSLGFISPNYLNFLLLGLAIVFHPNITSFMYGVSEAIGGAAGILIQFPLYFGIMGIMKSSGLVQDLSAFFVSVSSSETFPIYTMISAGIVNVFVPSGGGQWAIQGPIIIQATENLGAPLAKNILALAYGDQLTNMLQPFWALPLLGITGLKAKEILPYTLILMGVGAIIFLFSLLIF